MSIGYRNGLEGKASSSVEDVVGVRPCASGTSTGCFHAASRNVRYWPRAPARPAAKTFVPSHIRTATQAARDTLTSIRSRRLLISVAIHCLLTSVRARFIADLVERLSRKFFACTNDDLFDVVVHRSQIMNIRCMLLRTLFT